MLDIATLTLTALTIGSLIGVYIKVKYFET